MINNKNTSLNMLDFIKKYRIHILVSMMVILFFRSCGRGRTISKMEASESISIRVIDSLTNVIIIKDSKLDSIPDILRTERLSIYLSLDDTISRVDRTPQLMGFHTIIKDRIKDIQR